MNRIKVEDITNLIMTKVSPTQWTKRSWRKFPVVQQPDWPDLNELESVLETISTLPPLVFAGEIRSLKKILAEAAQGKAFLLQGGDCAEEFSQCTAPTIRNKLKVILQMAVILIYGGQKPVVKVGRIAGQYAKPRSSGTEMVNGIELPSFRGDCVNKPEPTLEARRPDAQRLLQAYFHAAATQNILRAFTRGGFAALHRVHAWNNEFVKNSNQGERYESLAAQIDQALAFMKVIGFDPEDTPQLKQVDFYTSHEALILGYEEALTRKDSLTGELYDCSAHMVWIGDRTRQADGAHIEFLRGVKNPIGIKIGPGYEITNILKLLSILNPENEWGRITLITRFGANKIGEYLPPLIRGIEKEGARVLWSCDPMHGNTFVSELNYKTRDFSEILKEIRHFFEIHRSENTVPGGVHFELTGDDVTECIGGAQQIQERHLAENYLTACDPRLNAQQSLELAFQIAEMLKDS